MKNWMKILSAATALLAMASLSLGQASGPKGGSGAKSGAQSGAKQGAKPGQPGGRMRMGGMGMSKEMMDKLELTTAQKTKIEALQKQLRADMEKMRPKDGSKTQPDREKMRAVFEKYQKAFNAILTPAQQKKLETLRKEMRAKFEKGGGRPGGPPPGGAAGKGGKGGG